VGLYWKRISVSGINVARDVTINIVTFQLAL